MPIARELNCTLAQMSLAWCLKKPRVSTVITGREQAPRRCARISERILASLSRSSARNRGTYRQHRFGVTWDTDAWPLLSPSFTAASRGISAACARRRAARGYRDVAVFAHDSAKSSVRDARAGDAAAARRAARRRFRRSGGRRFVVQETIAAYGRIDAAVVNNTGTPAQGRTARSSCDSGWRARGSASLLLNVVRVARHRDAGDAGARRRRVQ